VSFLCAALLTSGNVASADTAAFDLSGPKIDVRVQRAGRTLPIAQVPNLQAGDRLWVHADLPDSHSVHYLMVIVFLRGATNPPPENWFNRIETWNKAAREEGVYLTVPNEAEEALILLAPETGGAFTTLRAAVRGKPGAFVRAAQDLLQACRPASIARDWKITWMQYERFPLPIPSSLRQRRLCSRAV